MARVAQCDRVSALGGGAHGRQERNVLQILEFEGFQVVPAALVHPLSQDFNRGLGHVRLFSGHIQVIDKNDDSGLTIFGAETLLSAFRVHFGFDFLSNVDRCGPRMCRTDLNG